MEWMPAESFLAGIKPSCYECLSQVPPDVLKKLEKFPRFSVHPGYDIFFRDEPARDGFAKAVENLSRDSAEVHRLLGLVLGFPPRAVVTTITIAEPIRSNMAMMKLCTTLRKS
jgi:hypothetical protein